MTDNYIKPVNFLDAFKAVWEQSVRDLDKEKIIEAYGKDPRWTEFMLGNRKMSKDEKDNTLLCRVMYKLNDQRLNNKLEYYLEMHSIDLAYVSGEDLYETGLVYPSEWQVLIEHENANDEETEMYRLIFSRAPLKVIIFYDWIEDTKTTNRRQQWLENKLNKFTEMLTTANAYFPENEATEYLFIIGKRETEKAIPRWRYASIASKDNKLSALSNL